MEKGEEQQVWVAALSNVVIRRSLSKLHILQCDRIKLPEIDGSTRIGLVFERSLEDIKHLCNKYKRAIFDQIR